MRNFQDDWTEEFSASWCHFENPASQFFSLTKWWWMSKFVLKIERIRSYLHLSEGDMTRSLIATALGVKFPETNRRLRSILVNKSRKRETYLSEVSAGDSNRLRGLPWRDDNPNTGVSASSHRSSAGIDKEWDQETKNGRLMSHIKDTEHRPLQKFQGKGMIQLFFSGGAFPACHSQFVSSRKCERKAMVDDPKL